MRGRISIMDSFVSVRRTIALRHYEIAPLLPENTVALVKRQSPFSLECTGGIAVDRFCDKNRRLHFVISVRFSALRYLACTPRDRIMYATDVLHIKGIWHTIVFHESCITHCNSPQRCIYNCREVSGFLAVNRRQFCARGEGIFRRNCEQL